MGKEEGCLYHSSEEEIKLYNQIDFIERSNICGCM
jgi:hypothetical protein